MKDSSDSRITILTPEEVGELYARPCFNQTEREEYISISSDVSNVLKSREKTETKVYLILLLDYFRAKPIVPHFKLWEVKPDVDYVYATYFPNGKPKYPNIAKSTRASLITKMYSILGFTRLTKAQRTGLEKRLKDVATICTYPKYIFDECLAYLGQERIGLPGYTTLQNIVTTVLANERQRIETVLSKNMSDITQQQLHNILYTNGLLGPPSPET